MQRKGEAAKTGEQSQDKLYVRGKVEELKRSIKSRKRKIKIQLVKANIPEYIQTHGVVCERETEEREKTEIVGFTCERSIDWGRERRRARGENGGLISLYNRFLYLSMEARDCAYKYMHTHGDSLSLLSLSSLSLEMGKKLNYDITCRK